jgi:paraquat-inducible protein B
MSDPGHPTAAVRSRVDRRRRISLIWAVPLVTVLIAAWLVWDTYSKRGPSITITFDAAEGLQAGQSHVKHRDVDMGLVQSIALTEDLQHVLVTVQMNREAEPLLTDRTQFWVVKPRFFAGSISGLSTLLSGSYIELLPAPGAGKKERAFMGLENPPVLQSNTPGRSFLLKANRIGSITLGSPIFYRDLPVGEVLGWDLGDMAETVTVHAFVRTPFDQYVHDESRFWNASGVSVKLGAEGVQLQLESLKALLLGGIAFETPAAARNSAASVDNQTFELYANQEAANQAASRRRVSCLAYFQGSVSGLGAGSPVTFQGLRVGEVTSVNLEYDPKSEAVRAPVRFEVELERIAGLPPAVGGGAVANTRTLVQRGLRAQLQSANLLTGQMMVALAIMPNAPPAEMQVEGDVIVLPTVPGQLAGLSDSVNQLLSKLGNMPFEQIGANLNDTLRGFNEVANGRELKQSLASLQATMTAAQDLLKRLDAGASPALKQQPAIAGSLQTTLTQANRLLASADTGYGDNSRFSRNLDRLMLQLNDMARSFRAIADLLTRHPEALIRGRTRTGPE